MSTVHCQRLQKHYLFLLDTLELRQSTLVMHLRHLDVLSDREKQDVEAERTTTRRNEKLLSMLSRKSSEHFDKFLEALDKSGQRHIRDMIMDTVRTGTRQNINEHTAPFCQSVVMLFYRFILDVFMLTKNLLLYSQAVTRMLIAQQV